MFVTAWCSLLVALALFHYFFPSDFEKAVTNKPSETSEDNEQSSKNIEKCSSAFSEETSTSSSADQKTLSPSVGQTSPSPSVGQTSPFSSAGHTCNSSSADETPSISADQKTHWQSDQTSTLPFIEQTFPSPSTDQISLSRAADKKSPSPSCDQTSPSSSANQISASSYASQTYPSPCASQRFPSSSADQNSPSPSCDHTSPLSSANQNSASLSASQTDPSPCANQRFPSSSADQTFLPLVAGQRSPSPSCDHTSPSSSANQISASLSASQTDPSPCANQRFPSSSSDQTFLSPAADQKTLPYCDQASPSLSVDQISGSSSGSQTDPSPCANQIFPSSSADQTFLSLAADQRSPSPSCDQTSTSLSVDQTSASSSASQTYPSPCAKQRFSSSSSDQAFLSPAADQRSPSPSCDHTSSSSYADQTSPLSSVNQIYPSSCADQRLPSSFADQKSLLLSVEQRSHSLSSDQRSTSSSAYQTSFSLFADQTSLSPSGFLSFNQTLNSSFADQRLPSSCADQIRSAEPKKSLSPSIEHTNIFSLFPDQECSSSTFPGQKRPTLQFGDQPNSSSAVYHQTKPVGTIFDSWSNADTSCVLRPTMEAPRPNVSTQPCTMPSGPSECHTRPMVPTIADPTFPMVNESPRHSTIRQSTTSLLVPVSAAIGPLMSCDLRPSALSNHMSIQTTPLAPRSNVDFDTMFPTPTGCYIPDSIFSSSGTSENTSCEPGSVPTRQPLSCDIRPPDLPSLMSIPITLPVPSSNVTFDSRFPTPIGYSMPSSLSRTYGNAFCAPQSVTARPLISCDVRPPAIPSLMSIQTTPPEPSSIVSFGSRFPTPSSASRSYGNTTCVPESVYTKPLMSCEPTAIPSLMSIQTKPPVPSSDINFVDSRFHTPTACSIPRNIRASRSVPIRPLKSCDVRPPIIPSLTSIQTSPPVPSRFPTPIGYSIPSSASRTYGNAFCVPQSVTVGPLISCDVRPPVIPSLMSIQTTPPEPSSNVNFASKFPTQTGYSMPSSGSRTHGNTCCVLESSPTRPLMMCDVKPPAIPSLTSIQTTPPVPSFSAEFGGKCPTQTGYSMPSSASRTHGNKSCVHGSSASRPRMSCDVKPPAIPSLMSIQTTPPVPSSNVNFGSKFPTQTGFYMPSSASRTRRNKSCVRESSPTRPLMSCDVRPPAIPSLMSIQTTPPYPSSNADFVNSSFYTPTASSAASDITASRTYENTFRVPGSVPSRPRMSSDIRPPVIPSLMSIQTSPPVPSNDTRFLRNTSNRRRVPDSITTTIPSLMSIQTRPPWEPRPGKPYW